MKKTFTFTIACLLGLSSAFAQTFSDDFESYTVGSALGTQSPNWATWSGAGGGTEDVNVISTDNHTTSGSKSVYFSSTSADGGPTDCVLPFGTNPLTTGQFNFTAWFKIPASKNGYFNFQGTSTMGGMYVLDCYMNANGTINIGNSGALMLSGTYTQGQWFELSIDANLNTNTWELSVNGLSQGTWHNLNNQVYAIDIYPADATASYWMDDVSYNVTPYTLPTVNGAMNNLILGDGLAGQSLPITVKMRNQGTAAITSYDVSLDQNGGTPVVQHITGVNIASLATATLNFGPITLLSGQNTFRAIISNVNGAGPDSDLIDDTVITKVTPTTPAPGKMVAVEEGTGTWCGWCPRGAVYMDYMNEKYEGYFAGIAVHNNDPMTVGIYDAGVGNLISGYPSAIVDRLAAIDPSEMEADFITRIQVAPKATIVNGATYNTSTRELKVSLSSTIQQNITGNYKIACVIVEDSVTGTASGYNQSNYYAGGGSGVMGGFETLPGTVPAAQMNYNHVARSITPNFDGYANAFGSSANATQAFTHTFTFTLPASWDASQIKIMGLFIDPTGKIDNASSTTIATAVTNGYTSGTEILGVNNLNEIGSQVSLYPNPTNNNASITLNLEKSSSVSISIYNSNGVLVASKNYGSLNGGISLPIEMSNFSKGLYFVNINIDGNTTAVKLIKE